VTDAGLVHLGGLAQLKTLHLWKTRVTDAGLQHLKGLTKLDFLCLDGTKVTDAGVEGLQKAYRTARSTIDARILLPANLRLVASPSL